MPRTVLSDLTTWITEAALRHSRDLATHVAERHGTGRAAARAALQKLQAHHSLRQVGTPRWPWHVPGLLRQVVQRYPLQGLQDDQPCTQDFTPISTCWMGWPKWSTTPLASC